MKALSLAAIMLASAVPAASLPSPAAAAPARPVPADFKARADAMLDDAVPADGPGVAVIVTQGGRLVYKSARGLADLEAKKPVTPISVFKLGSIAKQFTAAAALTLIADGRLLLDDQVSKYFPDFPKPAADATVRQLLNHTSGVNDYSKIPGWVVKASDKTWTTSELIAEIRNRPAKTAPGAAWEYNNAGYALLGGIIEKVAAKPWHLVIRERVTLPLGLKSISYASDAASSPAMVRGYGKDGDRYEPTPAIDMSVAHAAGGLAGSVEDMAKWAQALHHGKVVSPPLYKEMISPARLADGSTRPYGFGLRLERLLGRPVFVHGGSGRGLDTDSVYLPDQDIFVAVFANTNDPPTDPSTLTRKLAALALGTPFPNFAPAQVPIAELEPLFGVYEGPGAPGLRFFKRGSALFFAQGDSEMEAIAAGGDRFFFGRDALTWVSIERKADGAHVVSVHRPDQSAAQLATRTGAVPADFKVAEPILRSYLGRYQTETVAVTVALGENGWLTIQPAGGNPIPLRPISETEFRADAGNFRILFQPSEGKVDGFTMYRGARELHGKRIKDGF